MQRTHKLKLSVLCALLSSAGLVNAATLNVGPGQQYSKPCAAFNAAKDGDTIQISATGNYNGDVCYINKNKLNIVGVNGRPKIDANGRYAAGKGIWAIGGTDNVIDNIEFSGAKVPDKNGAGIRLDGKNLTVKNSYFHDNENGILTANNGGNVTITNTEFARNGYGDGYSHNLYIGHIDTLTFIGNYSHDANAGHNLKSRAKTNIVKYNRFSSGTPGSTGFGAPSYEVDFPNGGLTYLIGNVIQQPSKYNNPHLVTYGVEGATNPDQRFYVVNNTFINDASYSSNFLFVGKQVTTPVLIQNNVFAGTGQITTQGTAVQKTNYANVAPAFVNKANYDLHPAPNSPMVDGGSTVDIVEARATEEYKHVAQTSARPTNGKIDIGAYESVGTKNPLPTNPMPTPIPPVSDANWKTCASEGSVCNLTGVNQVRYGANGKYVSKIISGSVPCTNAIFGDPVPSTTKSCSYIPAATNAPPGVSPLWVMCATENGTCNFTGTRQVRYGANDKYSMKTATGSIACNNSTFGDPIKGVAKSCSYSTVAR